MLIQATSPRIDAYPQVTDFIRLPDSGAVSLYIARATLRGLAAQPLFDADNSFASMSATMADWSPADSVAALPLWFVRTRAK